MITAHRGESIGVDGGRTLLTRISIWPSSEMARFTASSTSTWFWMSTAYTPILTVGAAAAIFSRTASSLS